MELLGLALLAAGVRLSSAELCSADSNGDIRYCESGKHCCKEGCCSDNAFSPSWFLYPGLLILMIFWFCIRIWMMSRQVQLEREELSRRLQTDMPAPPPTVYRPMAFPASATAAAAAASVPYRALSASPPSYQSVVGLLPQLYQGVEVPPPPYSSVVAANPPAVHPKRPNDAHEPKV